MNVQVTRRGKKVQAVFTTDGTLMEPSLERFAAAIGTVVHSMRAGDTVDCSFDRAGHIPMVCSRDIERVVKQAHRLPCDLHLIGLPIDLASIYSRYVGPAAAPAADAGGARGPQAPAGRRARAAKAAPGKPVPSLRRPATKRRVRPD